MLMDGWPSEGAWKEPPKNGITLISTKKMRSALQKNEYALEVYCRSTWQKSGYALDTL